jgi:hypothetical protein
MGNAFLIGMENSKKWDVFYIDVTESVWVDRTSGNGPVSPEKKRIM